MPEVTDWTNAPLRHF